MLEDGLFEAAIYKNSESNEAVNNSGIEQNEFGFPLSIFTKGNLLLPYLSLNGLDNLRSNSVRGYCIGVTNCIFRSNSDLHDAYITVRI